MAFVNADFVKESTSTTGTGTLSLAGAESGFRTFVAGIGNGNTCLYTIQASDGSWESGVGTVTDDSPDTLARTTLIASTTGSKLDLPSGIHYVFCAPSAAYYVDWTTDQGATNLHAGNIPDLSATYAVAAKGVTNGDSHDHSGGDGAQIAYASLSGVPTTWDASAITSGTLDIARIPTGTTGTTTALGNHAHSGVYEPADATLLKQADVDDTPVDGATTAPVSSNWAFDHAASTAPHPNELVPVQLVLSNDDTAIAVGARINRVRIPFAHEVTVVAISCDASSKGSSTALFNAHSINLSTGASTSLLTGDISLTSSDQYVAGTLTGTITGVAGAEYGFSCSQASTAKGVMGHLLIKRT